MKVPTEVIELETRNWNKKPSGVFAVNNRKLWSDFFIVYQMALGETIVKKLSKSFAPSTTVQLKVGRQDLAVRTDEHGNAVQVFIGKADSDGNIKGDRYARTLKYDHDGRVIKDHWERKGKAT